jgi:L-lysine 2,3-aminomutase
MAGARISPPALLQELGLPADHPLLAAGLRRRFPLRVTESYRGRMRRGDIHDPLFRQVWPHTDEATEDARAASDPVGDMARLLGDGVIHKYHGRALLITTGACAIHCRYCFRREFPYAEQTASRGSWQAALSVIANDPSITEIILSGGDPLSLADRKLAALVSGLEAIPHLRRLRIHTRQPIVLPQRVGAALQDWLRGTRLQNVVVVHTNHAQEINDEVREALHRLRDTGATLLNQAVLLRGVNDTTNAQTDLSESLFDAGVLPYYLHLLDPVNGAMHFDVPTAEARQLIAQMSARLPGYLVPKLVREIAGEPAKTVLATAGDAE